MDAKGFTNGSGMGRSQLENMWSMKLIFQVPPARSPMDKRHVGKLRNMWHVACGSQLPMMVSTDECRSSEQHRNCTSSRLPI